MMHLHCAQAGVNNPRPVLTLCPDETFDNHGNLTRFACEDDDVSNVDNIGQSCNGVEINNLASLYQAMRDGSIYWNAHTNEFPGGEIRGQVFTL